MSRTARMLSLVPPLLLLAGWLAAAPVTVREEQGLVVVRTAGPGGAELVAVDPGGFEDEAFACVRAEEVLLEPLQGHPSSAQNRLAGLIVSRRDEGPLSRITVSNCARLAAAYASSVTPAGRRYA
jgi:hypothetical protein